MAAQPGSDHRLEIMALLAPRPVDRDWEAEKAGWRSFVMGNTTSGYPSGSRLQAAWQRGYDAASRSNDPVGLML